MGMFSFVLDNPITSLGYIYAFKLIYSITVDLVHGFKSYVLPKLWRAVFKQESFVNRFGEWAVVTGCTQGIGRAYVSALAARGMNVVLVSRNREVLMELAASIEETHKVKAYVIVADFTDNKAVGDVVHDIKSKDLDIGVLVNNVGIFGPHFMPFLELEERMVQDMINVNITVATLLCHAILPGMNKKNKGAIINMCSSSSFYTMPYLSEYSATKHYISAFTAGLQAENFDSQVIIQELDPGQVSTNMTKDLIEISSIEAPPPGALVESSLSTLGFSKQTGGWWFHSLHYTVVSWLFPEWFLNMFLKMFGRKQYEYSLTKVNKSK